MCMILAVISATWRVATNGWKVAKKKLEESSIYIYIHHPNIKKKTGRFAFTEVVSCFRLFVSPERKLLTVYSTTYSPYAMYLPVSRTLNSADFKYLPPSKTNIFFSSLSSPSTSVKKLIAAKSVLHVQQDYFSAFNKLNHRFVTLLFALRRHFSNFPWYKNHVKH